MSWLITVRHIHAGELRVVVYHGSSRSRWSQSLHTHDVILTNYDTLRSEWTCEARDSPLYSQEWARIVLDEGESYSSYGK